ncbi:metal-dependent transcriptional regulator [Penaeicola halotolerans]|uniref:metal-dependent transcriptional regulator n=1 Tax=Penaeicola halotolerans TaxID=2793196 RepID=UPI001CF829B2|nr:metal-dependent transcriptional regulator [Penaeicola halotolerans]
MKSLTYAEENYLKAIYHLSEEGKKEVSTNSISDELKTKPASVSDMIKKLAVKGVINHKKYQGVRITTSGIEAALQIVRKHRLWEVFLVNKLNFNWDEVHEVAEELEHIQSPLLIQRLDEFLGYPKYDPHGDPIPDETGTYKLKPKTPLNELQVGDSGQIIAVKDSSAAFLQYLDKVGAYIGAKIRVIDKVEFDGSLEILVDNKKNLFVSKDVSKNILITNI